MILSQDTTPEESSISLIFKEKHPFPGFITNLVLFKGTVIGASIAINILFPNAAVKFTTLVPLLIFHCVPSKNTLNLKPAFALYI